MYHATIKENRKVMTVATWTGGKDTCQAVAEDVFRAHGVKFESVSWDNVTTQKNWRGFAEWVTHLTDSPREGTYHFHARIIGDYVQMMGASKAYAHLLNDWQDDPESIVDLNRFFNIGA